MSSITHVPPSVPIILRKIEEHEKCIKKCTCENQRMCHELVIIELELILEELKQL